MNPHDSAKFTKAKQLFIRNLILCSSIALIIAYFHFTDEPEPDITEQTSSPSDLDSLLQQASFLGQAHGLDEDPEQLSKLPDERLREEALKAMQRHSDFNKSPLQAESLFIDAYCEGYHARFEEVYKTRDGYEAGYLFGLKTRLRSELEGADPLKVQHTPYHIRNNLIYYKERATQKHTLDEAQWILFKRDFMKGYSAGYASHDDTITLKSSEVFEMIEP